MKLATSSLFFAELNFHEKFKKAVDLGFEGIEIRLEENPNLFKEVDQIEKALSESTIIACSLIIRSPAFRAPLISLEAKNAKLKSAKIAIEIAARLKVPTILQPEYGPQNPLPLFDELRKPNSDDIELFRSFLLEAVNIAEKHSTVILLEPINRYETHYHHRLEEAMVLCDSIGSEKIKICADFFHMSIEEKDLYKSINDARGYIYHVHLADSNRCLPGQGHTDFVRGFEALRHIGYDRFLALECKTPSNIDELIDCKVYLDHCLEESKAQL